MTTHRRIRSGRSHSHIVVSIELDNHTLHLSGTVHSRTGGPLVITDGSTELKVDQLLQSVPDITLRYGLNRSETSCSFVWSDSTVAPDQVEWVGLRATVWRIYEQGESMESYGQREVLLLGMVTDVLIESSGDIVSLSIQCDPLLDYGDLYGADEELGPTEFPDMDGVSAGQPRSRAYRAKALLPPIPICRAGGPLESPVMVVQDEQAPVGSTSLEPRRYLVSREPLANKSVTRNLRVVKPNQDNQVFRPDTLFQSSLTDGVGSTGRAYTYLAGDLSVNFGTTLTAWSNGSTTVSAPAQGGRVGVGDVVKATGHAGTAWAEVASVDGTAITLTIGYQGASTTAQGEVILLPADTAYPVYILVGGASGDGGGVAWGTAPLHTAVDVVDWAMRRAVSTIPVDHWRSTSLRSVSSSYSVSTVINERVTPTAWVTDMIVSWCPLDLTVSDGQIEPRWSTVVLGGTRLDRSGSTVAQLNVYDPTVQSDPYWTSDPSVVHLEPVRIEGVYQTAWTAQYAWSVRSGRYESVVSVPRCGRVIQMEQVGRRQHRRDGVSRSSQVNRVELSAVGEADVALRSLLHRLRIEGVPDCTVRVSVAPHLAWLRCGDFVSLSVPSLPTAIQAGQVWRVDEMVLSDQMTILLRLIRQ